MSAPCVFHSRPAIPFPASSVQSRKSTLARYKVERFLSTNDETPEAENEQKFFAPLFFKKAAACLDELSLPVDLKANRRVPEERKQECSFLKKRTKKLF
jgi:hypothetical protein